MKASLAAALLLLGCGSSTSASETPPEPENGSGAEVQVADPEPAPVTADPRSLPAGATFGDLVERVRTLDERGGDRSSAGCLLRAQQAGVYLAGDLSASLRPLPAPPVTIDLPASGPVRVFSRWGQRGSGRPVLAAFTSTPPPVGGEVIALFINDEGASFRSTEGNVGREADDASLATVMTELLARGPSRVLVTAPRAMPMARVMTVLGALPDDAASLVALAVVLGEDTALPDPPARGEGDTGLCSAAPARSPGAPGQLDAASAREAIAPLQSAAECLRTAAPESAVGGRISVELIVGSDGSVARACALSDEIGDSGVRTCLLDHVRRLQFPSPNGEVTLRFPVLLEPNRSDVQRALCEAP